MKLSRTKNTLISSIWGILEKVISIIVPFIIRTIIIHKLGEEYAGLNSLFVSILRVFNMAELGYAGVIAFSLYKPAADEDTAKISALLSFYRKLFYITGLIVIGVGISLIPFLHNFVKEDVPPDINLYILYGIYLIETASSYFLYAYKNVLLNVYQRTDISSRISILLRLVTYAFQIVVLLTISNYYLYLIFEPVYYILCNILVARRVSQLYPDYKCYGTIGKEERKYIYKNIYGLLLSKISITARRPACAIIVSATLGLTAVAIFDNYYYVINALTAVQAILLNSMKGGIGNSIVTESPHKNHNDMHKFIFMYAWLTGCFSACLVCCYQDFMNLWVGAELMISNGEMFLFVLYYYVLSMGDIRYTYHQAAGLYWNKRYYTIVEAFLNIVLAIILLPKLGMIAVIVSCLISCLLVNFGYSSRILYQYYFKGEKIKLFYLSHLRYFCVNAIACILCWWICSFISLNGLALLVIKLIVAVVFSSIVFFIVYRKNYLFIESIEFIYEIVKDILPTRAQKIITTYVRKNSTYKNK